MTFRIFIAKSLMCLLLINLNNFFAGLDYRGDNVL